MRGHSLVLGEIACGTPPNRAQTLTDIGQLLLLRQARVPEAMALLERENLFGLGCGLVDLMLLASTLITPAAKRVGGLTMMGGDYTFSVDQPRHVDYQTFKTFATRINLTY